MHVFVYAGQQSSFVSNVLHAFVSQLFTHHPGLDTLNNVIMISLLNGVLVT